MYVEAGGRALIPKNAFGWPILASVFFARVGSFSCLFPRLSFLISIFQFGGAISFSVFETICGAEVLQPGGKGGPASGRETGQRCARRHPWL
jgi:hypothetical protein